LSFRSEVLVFFFGMLVILVTFGDDHIGATLGGFGIGNLDTIFGQTFWPVLDVIYPLATVLVFLLYGWTKQGRLRITASTVLLFVSFLAVIALVNFDDLAIALRLAVYPPQIYWSIILWIYPVYSGIALFLFGKANEK
jgi:hypothetical protein